jgi:hypothetical protein
MLHLALAAAARSSNGALGKDGMDIKCRALQYSFCEAIYMFRCPFIKKSLLPLTPCSIKASGIEFSWLVVVINLSLSALNATSAVHRMSINYFSSSMSKEDESFSRGRCRRHACSHRGCDRPSSVSSAWASCCQRQIRSHHFWDGRNRSSLQCVRNAQCARYARCGLQWKQCRCSTAQS